MKVYVGTYAKYNAGSIKGAWIDLDKFGNYEEFVKECRRVHRGERDPEFMVQDVEHDGDDWQAGFTGESLSDYADYWTVKAEAEENAAYAAKVAGAASVLNDENVNTPEIREAFAAEQAKNWGDKRMVDHCVKSAEVVVRLTGGELVGIERPSITTSHCEGEDDGRGRSIAEAQAGCDFFKTETGFKRTNIRGFDREMIIAVGRKRERMLGEPLKFYVTTKYCGGTNTLICDCHRTARSWVYGNAIRREANAEDIRRLRLGYMIVRRSFIRRVNAYWRRFGNSKLRTWTYWTEA